MLVSGLLMARVRAIAVVLPIVTVAPSAAAAAASPPPIAVAMGVVAAMLLLGFHGLALPVGTVVGGKRLVVADSVARVSSMPRYASFSNRPISLNRSR